ncbi:MAG: nucleotidyl transferase AbiEii/AbiGii toxin family protein [Desulfuromonadales bacterium]
MPAEFYNKVLYPLQEKVLTIFQDFPFYLTGGTALSRGYYHHRYSDDLDLFVNDSREFERLVFRVIAALKERFEPLEVTTREDSFCRLFVGAEQLKIEMINDVPAHVGDIVSHPYLGRLDSRENILANKITALVDRGHPKDVADIFYLLKDGLSLKRALTDADSKAAGITPLLVARIFGEYRYEYLSTVNWIAAPDVPAIRSFLTNVAITLVEGNE